MSINSTQLDLSKKEILSSTIPPLWCNWFDKDNNAIQENNESRAKERHFTDKVLTNYSNAGWHSFMTVAEKQKDALSLFMKSGRRHFHFSLLLISAEKWKDVLLPYAWKSLEFPSVRRFPLPSVGHRSPSPAREERSLFWWNWWYLHDIVFDRIIFSFSF